MSSLKTYLVDPHILEVGVDEVGRGCLFGPVYAAAVFWDPEMSSNLIKDSKQISHRQRLIAKDFIKENCLSYGIGSATVLEIDTINILQASMTAMHRAIQQTNVIPQHILVDGTYFNLYETSDGDFIPHTTIEKGDSLYYSIAAASILAKEERDYVIEKMCLDDPQLDVYDLKSNKGYGSPKHLSGIKDHGITFHHRKTFGICKSY